MGFLKNGQPHFIGVSNEVNIIEYINSQKSNNPFNEHFKKYYNTQLDFSFTHVGTTKTKIDCLATNENGVEAKISIKNHKTGTFDWLNSSKDIKIGNIKDCIDEEQIDECLSQFLDNMNMHQLNLRLLRLFKEYPEWIIINDKKYNRLILINKNDFIKFFKFKRQYFLYSPRNAKTSRQLWYVKDEKPVNSYLRIRVVLNNGKSVFLGKSCLSPNKSSIPCLKIQQDNVDKVLEEINCKVYFNLS